MKNKLLWVALPAIALAGTYFILHASFSANARCQSIERAASVIGVDTLMKAPECYPGRTIVQGVVSTVFPSEKAFVLIDSKEVENCGGTHCPLRKLPVQWSGSMPAIKSELVVQGEVKKIEGKFAFAARSLERVGTQSLKGTAQ